MIIDRMRDAGWPPCDMGDVALRAAHEMRVPSEVRAHMGDACADAWASFPKDCRGPLTAVGASFLLPDGRTVDVYRASPRANWCWGKRDRCSPIRSSSVWWWTWELQPFEGYVRLAAGCSPGGLLDGLWKIVDKLAAGGNRAVFTFLMAVFGGLQVAWWRKVRHRYETLIK